MVEKLITKTKRTRVIANFQPSKLDHETIGAELHKLLTEKFGDVINGLDFEIRSPEQNLRLANYRGGIGKFHHDVKNADIIMIVWSNVVPTKVRLMNGKTIRTRNGDVILIINREASHCMPVAAVRESPNRWFYRKYLGSREPISLI